MEQHLDEMVLCDLLMQVSAALHRKIQWLICSLYRFWVTVHELGTTVRIPALSKVVRIYGAHADDKHTGHGCHVHMQVAGISERHAVRAASRRMR